MADFGAPVAAGVNVNPAQSVQTLSGILGLKQQQQALQTGQYTQQSAQANAIQQQQAAKEMRAGASLMSDPVGAGITDADGKPTDNAYSIIKRVMPITGDTQYKNLLDSATTSVNYKNAWSKMTGDQQNMISSRLAGVAADPNTHTADLLDTLDKIKDEHSDEPQSKNINKLVESARNALTKVNDKHGADAAKQVALQLSRGGLGNQGITGAGGIAAPQQATMDTGAQIQPGTQAPALAGGAFTPGGSPVNKSIAPSIVNTPTGQIGAVTAGGGSVRVIPGAQGAGAPQTSGNQLPAIPRPGPNDPAYTQQQYKTQNDASLQHVQGVTAAMSDPQNNPQAVRYRNNEILRLTDVAPTGPGKEVWNHFASQFPGESGTAYQKIGHYLAQNTIANLNSMGVPNTNAGADVSAAATGNVSQNPGAIKEITKVNDAVNTAREKYAQGLQKVTQNQSNMDRVPAYRQAFGQAFDMNLFRLEDAQRRGDKKEIADISQKLGPAGLKALGPKKRLIDSLTTTGQLPQ